jgi:hypothetical protein
MAHIKVTLLCGDMVHHAGNEITFIPDIKQMKTYASDTVIVLIHGDHSCLRGHEATAILIIMEKIFE